MEDTNEKNISREYKTLQIFIWKLFISQPRFLILSLLIRI